MRISDKRWHSRIRTTKAHTTIREALIHLDPKTTSNEINMALIEILHENQNQIIINATPQAKITNHSKEK